MKNNKLNNLVALASIGASLLVGGATSSQAAVSLGANFIGRNNSASIMVQTDSAGVIPQANWNNIDTGGTFIGTSDPLLSSDGKFTAVTLDYAAQDSWVSDGPTVTGDEKMMKGILKFKDAANGGPGSITFKNLPAGTYDAYVYCEEDGTGAEGEIAIGSVTNYIKVDNIFSGTYSNYPASAPGAPVSGNYAKWSAVAPAADGSLMLKAVKTSVANNGIGIAGFQLVQVSGGAFPANTNTCSITADPASTKGLVGATAAFSVGTAGPCKIMWKKNGTVIPGATSPVLNYNYTLADDNAAFVAVVYNNVNTNNSAAATLTVYSASRGVSVNFIGRGNDQFLGATDAAGVLGAAHWNNTGAGTFNASTGPLDNANGEFTAVDLTFTFPDSWNSDGPTVTANDKMMKGIMKVQNQNAANPTRNPAGSIVLRNLDTNAVYDIYTYHTENGASTDCNLDVAWVKIPLKLAGIAM